MTKIKEIAEAVQWMVAGLVTLGIVITLYLCFMLVNVKIVKWFWYL